MPEAHQKNLFLSVALPVIYIAVLLVSIVLTVYFIRERLIFSPNAQTSYKPNTQLSLENSYLFSSPVRAKTGGDLIRVTIFILDNQGLAVADKKVILNSSEPSLNIRSTQAISDETGKAIFDVSSDAAGLYYLEVLVEGELLDQKARLLFD